jgi:hypothetical protein
MGKKPFLSKPMQSFLFNLLAFIPYLLYIGYVVANNLGPVDYETFMEIGSRIPLGKAVFDGNSYYPAPFVYLFTLLYLLPRSVSLIIWLLTPILTAWMIVGKKPWVLFYGPLFANFLGGQSALFAMLGMWGFMRSSDINKWSGGIWLGIIAFKPHLAVFPAVYAAREWLVSAWRIRKIPKQAFGFSGMLLLWYLIGVPIGWDWPVQWLSNPRPVFFRAQAGIIPRTLAVIGVEIGSINFWIGALLGVIMLGLVCWWINHRRMPMDLWMFVIACFYPLMHDYDLIQLIPFLDTPLRRRWALIASIPLWWVMLFAYANDQAWFVVTLIPPIMVGVALVEKRNQKPAEVVQTSTV